MRKRLTILFFIIIVSTTLFGQSDFFWERDWVFSERNIGKFSVVKNDKIALILYSEVAGQFNLYTRYTEDGYKWSNEELIVKDFFSNNPKGVDYSASVDSNKNLYLCYRNNRSNFTINKFSYPYNFKNPEKLIQIDSKDAIFLPYLFVDSNDDIHLLYSSSQQNIFVIEYKKVNKDGEILVQNKIGKNLKSAINPKMVEDNGILYIVFQAKDDTVESGYFYNIILGNSRNYGKSWGYKRVVTSEGENNQGPDIFVRNQKVMLVWEKEDENFVSHIYYKVFLLNYDGAADEVLISDLDSEAHSPHLAVYNDIVNIFWYDDESGRFQNYFSQVINDDAFDGKILKEFNYGRVMSNRAVPFNKSLLFFWITSYRRATLNFMKNDTYVRAPRIVADNVPESRLLDSNDISFRWNLITDISGVKGYRVLLTDDREKRVNDNSTLIYYKELTKEYENLSDGDWYFKIKSYDNAGNDSDESVFAFSIDTTPPLPPVFIDPSTDENGTLLTNSPTINWTDSNEKIKSIVYTYHVFERPNEYEIERYLEFLDKKDFQSTEQRSLELKNLDNGLLMIGARGYDKVGNLSDIVWKQYNLNKYVAVTYISYVISKTLANGDNVFRILGRGFNEGGQVGEIYIDKDKKEPYDYTLSDQFFNVESDRVIQQIKGLDIEDGSYYIGVNHPVRGVSFFDVKSTYKGEWTFNYDNANYFSFSRVLFLDRGLNFTKIFFIIIIIFWAAIVLVLSHSLFSVIREKIYIKHLLSQLESVKREMSGIEYKRRKDAMVKKGIGLTLKYTILILSLVIVVVTATSLTLSVLTLGNETRNLANEMKERANLVMTNYETTMVDIYTYEKGFTEAVDATVNTSTLPDISFAMFREVNGQTFLRYGEKEEIFFRGINIEGMTNDEKQEIIIDKVFTKETEADIAKFKEKFDGNAKIYPEFDPARLKNRYIFIKPVIVEGKDKNKYEAEIVIGYSFEKILKLIKSERFTLIKITLIVILIAILFSAFGAVFLATTTIRPIKKMSEHVNLIATIDDYEKLLGTENEKIEIDSKDEIGLLASSINDMTNKLIEKAKADKQMMLGKEIQKKFIPLEPHETDNIDIYGFYEGAKGVSGDYFDFKKIDDEHYAFIICDVAGKAVPAALIMVQISTIFHSFCANLVAKKEKLETVGIVNTINDTVAEREFSGRFAAILVLILNIKTGKAILTNAGYTQLLVYRHAKKEAEFVKLDENSGAAGVFPSYMLPNPYVQEKLQVDKGDIIYLFTDGIEESRNGKTVTDHEGNEQPEEFGLTRIKEVFDKADGKTSKEIIDMLVSTENKFRGNLEQYDDLTILAVRRK